MTEGRTPAALNHNDSGILEGDSRTAVSLDNSESVEALVEESATIPP